MPWVRQWHDDIDADFGRSWAAAYDEFLTAQRLTYHLTDQDLASVKPPPQAPGILMSRACHAGEPAW